MRLRDIAYSRSGDKGNISNVSVIAYDHADWDVLRSRVTVPLVAELFADIVEGPIRRYELPRLAALNFVMEGALDGGVSLSLRADPWGKSFESLILMAEL